EQLEEEKRQGAESRRREALAQVDRLIEATPAGVPTVLARLEQDSEVVLPRLRELYFSDKEDQPPSIRLRLALALLPHDSDNVIEGVAEYLLVVEDPAEALLIRAALKPHADRLVDWLWEQAGQKGQPHAQLRALVALAEYA